MRSLAKPKIDLAQVRSIALKARPGHITDQELEKEAGGSGLRYSFDIASHGKTTEVGVDAVTGKVLENGAESAGKEARVSDGGGPHDVERRAPARQEISLAGSHALTPLAQSVPGRG